MSTLSCIPRSGRRGTLEFLAHAEVASPGPPNGAPASLVRLKTRSSRQPSSRV